MELNILPQDNTPTIVLATNAIFSSASKIKHIRHKLFLITDKIHQGDIEVEYKYTERIWSNMLIKLRQGKAFRKFCGYLMTILENCNY